LRHPIEPLRGGPAEAEVWLFGSLARGDWDARSDVDLLAPGLANAVCALSERDAGLALQVAQAVVSFADQQLTHLPEPGSS
jgi:predicted nucleotidyltransferase